MWNHWNHRWIHHVRPVEVIRGLKYSIRFDFEHSEREAKSEASDNMTEERSTTKNLDLVDHNPRESIIVLDSKALQLF